MVSSDIADLRSVVYELAQAQLRTDQRLEALTARVDALAGQVGALATRVDALTARVDALAEAQQRTERRLEALVATVDRLAAAMETLATRAGRTEGRLLELTYREKAGAYFGPLVRRMRLVTPHVLEDEIEDRVTPEEFDELLRLDLLIAGRPRRVPFDRDVWLAVDVSSAIDPHDISRARHRASILRRAGVAAVPVVAGERLTDEAADRVSDDGVVVLLDGRVSHWEEALAGLAADSRS